MKKTQLIIFLILVFSFFSYISVNTEQEPHIQIRERYNARILQIEKDIADLENLTNQQKKASKEIILNQYFKLRNSYKKWEYLGEYLHPEEVKELINAAPLQKIEKNSFAAIILEPKGMQVIDELMAENVLDLKLISKHLQNLKQNFIEIKSQTQPIYDRSVLEASRINLIRVFTLGVTGFDTPGTLHGVQDAASSLEAIHEDLLLYKELFTKTNRELSDSLYTLLETCAIYLNNKTDFETFDRLEFLTKFINPLYSSINTLHLESGIESIYESNTLLTTIALNLKSSNLFSEDFLDHTFYTNIPQAKNTNKWKELGKLLFFDPILSENNKRACASCHNPNLAFTDAYPKSLAIDSTKTMDRNSPTLINCVYSEKFFHDMRAETLEGQIEHVLTGKTEFNLPMLDVVKKLEQSKEYVNLFKDAFDEFTPNISMQTISFALTSYVSSLRNFDSPFDRYVQGKSETIPENVAKGFNLFMGKAACGTCHFAPVFNGTVPPFYIESESEVLGVPENPRSKKLKLDDDIGRAGGKMKENVTIYNHSFKTPSIRNLSKSAPYMHNGSYTSLEEVMDFYNKGGGLGLGLEVENQTLSGDKLNLNKKEINQIIEFLNYLNTEYNIDNKPVSLPKFDKNNEWNNRKIGGEY